jgi:hypothetical protein
VHLEKPAARAHITGVDRREDEGRRLTNRLRLQLVDQRIDALQGRGQNEEARDRRASETFKKQLESVLKN